FNLTKFENDLLWSECFATHLMPSMAPPYTNFLGGPVFWGQVTGRHFFIVISMQCVVEYNEA
ncbi:hypothetical protein, partial [Desulfovibrio desulfuricans]|uniref:hypothetical protein n=1 Tax=Desulfovibrio desulfuricans TaxID=876 RepID=UPI0035B1C6A3